MFQIRKLPLSYVLQYIFIVYPSEAKFFSSDVLEEGTIVRIILYKIAPFIFQ